MVSRNHNTQQELPFAPVSQWRKFSKLCISFKHSIYSIFCSAVLEDFCLHEKITSLPLAPFRKMNIFSQSKILQLDLTFVLMSLRLFGNSGMCTFLQCLVWGIRAIRRCDNSNMGDSEIILTMKWWFIWMWGLKKERERGLEGPHRIFKTRCKKRSQTHP